MREMLMIGYLVGIPVALLTTWDILRRPRRAFRLAGHSQRRWAAIALASALTGWGALVVGVAWALGYARRDVHDVVHAQRRA